MEIKMTVPTFILGLVLLTLFGIAVGVALNSTFSTSKTYIAHYNAGELGYPAGEGIIVPEQPKKRK